MTLKTSISKFLRIKRVICLPIFPNYDFSQNNLPNNNFKILSFIDHYHLWILLKLKPGKYKISINCEVMLLPSSQPQPHPPPDPRKSLKLCKISSGHPQFL